MPPQGAPGGSLQLGTPGVGPGHWGPSHGLSCSSEPSRITLPKSPISPRVTSTMQVDFQKLESKVTKAPIIPLINSPLDTSNYEHYDDEDGTDWGRYNDKSKNVFAAF